MKVKEERRLAMAKDWVGGSALGKNVPIDGLDK